jgi:5'-nucleotidase/2',3'-cyclic-nucleotide 2'-phosphodiesterase/3'-nucleotidase
MQSKALFLFAFLLTFSLGAPDSCSPEQAHSNGLTLFFGDSLNGTIEPCPSCDGGSPLGGLARRGAWLQRARENTGASLLLDSGDLFFERYRKAIPPEKAPALGEKAHLILACYRLLGYDALGIGDDDLTLGKDFLVGLSKQAGFPFVSSNLVDKETGHALFETHVIMDRGGLKIGVFSLLSPNFVSGESDPRTGGIAFREPVEEAKRILGIIRPETDLVVLLSHLGFTADIELAEAVQGIDVILGGHSSRSLSYPIRIRDTIIVQVGSKGLYVGELRLQPTPGTSSLLDSSLKAAIPLSSSGAEHPEIAERVKAYKMKHSPEWFTANEICPEP